MNVQRPANSPAPSLQTPGLRPDLRTLPLCGLGQELFQAHSWGVLWRLKILFPLYPVVKTGWPDAYGAGFAQCERPVVQGPGLHGKEIRKSFVERADLLKRPLRTRTVGGVGGDG